MSTRSPEVLSAPGEPVDPAAPRPRREPRGLPPAVRIRRAVTLLVMSCLVPGSAQLVAGNRRVGRLVLRAWLAVAALLVLLGLVALVSRSAALSLLTSPPLLVTAALGCYLAAVVMPLVIGDAWRLAGVRELPVRPRRAIGAAAVVLMVVSSGVLVGTGRRLWAGADLIRGIFGADKVSSAADGRFNVLLLGGDAGPDRIGTRPDSMTLASIDAATGRTVLFSLPRNLENVPFPAGSAAARELPQGWSCGDECLLNAIYTWGSEHKALFPGAADAGAEAMKQAVEGVTGLRVNYYVLIDLRGFSQLIDAMGGIRLTVTQRVPIGGGTSKVSGYLEPGTRTLDGYHALWFARSRHGASDYERMARQRCVMDAMLHQLDPATVLAKFQDIAAAGKQVVSTDVPAGELGTFLDLAARAKAQRISSVQFVPPLITPARPDLALVRSKVAAAIDASRRAEPTPSARAGSPSAAAAPKPSPAAAGASPSAAAAPVTGPAAETSDISAICSPA